MRYQLRQKLLALGDDFTIRDEQGQPVYYVDGKALSFGKKLSFLDATRTELLFIKQKLFSWRPNYHFMRRGELVAVVERKLWTLFRPRYTVRVVGEPDLSVRGDLFGHDYVFKRGEEEVARVSKAWFRLADTYGVEVGDGEDPVLILACAVVIDLMARARRRD